MKVVYCLVDLVNSGGIERVTTDKLNALYEDGEVEPVVVTTSQCGKEDFFPLNENVHHIDLGIPMGGALRNIKGIVFRLRALWKIKKALEDVLIREGADICVFVARPDFLLFPFKKWKGATILESHFSLNLSKYTRQGQGVWMRWLNWIVFALEKRLRKRADAFVVLTKFDRECICRKEANVHQIYNPCLPAKERSPVNSKVAVAVGRLTFQKGFSYLISAWEIVARDFPDWTLEIWGEGELREELQKQIDNSGLSQCVFLRGRTSSISEKYQSASLFILSSVYEGLGMVLLEAMAVGVPVVSFDCQAGPSEIVKDGVNGYLVPPEDVELLAASIKKVLGVSIEERQLMGEASLRLLEKFSVEVIVSNWKELFRELIVK